ncbi:MAG: lysylphosphatidylglycerol synthase transmembrane domain-containing protein [Pseudomonadota bacterium]
MKKTALTIIGWVISIALLASLATRMDFSTLWAGMLGASWFWLTAAAIINIAVVALKAQRWKQLMQTGQNVPYGGIFKATVIGMAGNNVLPARGGDWMKIYLIDKWAGSGKAMLASVMGLDKLFDGLAILILFGFLSFHSTFPAWVQRGTMIVSIVIAVSLAICIILLLHHRRLRSDHQKDTGRLSRLASRFGSGMSALASGNLVAATMVNSVFICLLQVATIWCCQIAFGQHLDVWVPALVYVAINLAIIVPSAPSGIGPFEAAAVLAYGWLGVHTETAGGITLMYHAVQFFPITIMGFIFYLGRGHSLKSPGPMVEKETT